MGTTARLDRFLLTLIALLLTALGVLGLLAGFGVFGSRLRNQPVLDNVVSRYLGDNGAWLWPVIALVALLLGYLALRWVIAQLRLTGVGNIELEPGGSTGRTDVVGVAITSVVREEINSYRGVASSSARLTGDARDPHLQLRVQLDSRADVASLRQRIETGAIAHAREALDLPELPVRLDLIVTDKQAARVS